jgi:hypothetical protein
MKAAKFFAAHDGFGERRAGSAGDLASAAWLRDLAAQAGAMASLVPVAFPMIVPGPSRIAVQSRDIAGLPLFDGGTTGGSDTNGTSSCLVPRRRRRPPLVRRAKRASGA